ncbi:MAG TPA: hypothetical protein VF800_02480 [Telluria sp.]|jgi:hypothetical protein
MTQASTEVQIALLIHGQALLQREIEENKREAEVDLKRVQEKADAGERANAARIAAIEAERTKALIWGISTLGAAVLLMGSWILTKLFTGGIKW